MQTTIVNLAGKGSNPKTTLYVGGLDDSVTDSILHAAFLPFGDVTDVSVPMDHATGKHRGFGFVQYESSEDAADAIDNMHNAGEEERYRPGWGQWQLSSHQCRHRPALVNSCHTASLNINPLNPCIPLVCAETSKLTCSFCVLTCALAVRLQRCTAACCESTTPLPPRSKEGTKDGPRSRCGQTLTTGEWQQHLSYLHSNTSLPVANPDMVTAASAV